MNSHSSSVTTDDNRTYLNAVEDAFGADVDYAMLVKIYGVAPGGEVRYSPSEVTGAIKAPVNGKPDLKHVSTSFVERQNLTMRMHMHMRRFTRLTNAFSKKLANHEAAIALHYMHDNFARIHQSLRVTPAMAAGASDRVWSIAEIVALLDEARCSKARERSISRRMPSLARWMRTKAHWAWSRRRRSAASPSKSLSSCQ